MARAASKRHHFVHLDVIARADLAWWGCFPQQWQGASLIIPGDSSAIHVYSDASGSYGCGAYNASAEWIQVQRPVSWQKVDISAKEMVPIVLAAAIWGREWHRHHVVFYSDNAAVAAVIQQRSARDPLLLHLLRCLNFYAAHFQFRYTAKHVPRVLNVAANAISRDKITLFQSLVPQATQLVVGQALLDLLVSRRPDWGSPDWIRLFRDIL